MTASNASTSHRDTAPTLIVRTSVEVLQPFLTDLCGVSFAAGERSSRVAPDACAAIVVHATESGIPAVFVRGPSTRAGRFPRGDLRWAAGAQLRAGFARRLVGVPLDTLVDALVPLDELWRAETSAIVDAIAGADTMETRLQALESALLGRLVSLFGAAEPTVAERSVRQAVAILERDPTIEIGVLTACIGISARQLRRQFNEWIGVGPKEYAGVLRFQRAADALAAGRSCAETALAAGYYDQAHMNLDFRRRTGGTPQIWAIEDG